VQFCERERASNFRSFKYLFAYYKYSYFHLALSNRTLLFTVRPRNARNKPAFNKLYNTILLFSRPFKNGTQTTRCNKLNRFERDAKSMLPARFAETMKTFDVQNSSSDKIPKRKKKSNSEREPAPNGGDNTLRTIKRDVLKTSIDVRSARLPPRRNFRQRFMRPSRN